MFTAVNASSTQKGKKISWQSINKVEQVVTVETPKEITIKGVSAKNGD
jgi:hypothetical protein